MEVLAIILGLLTGAGGGAGFLVDQTARQVLLDQLDQAEVLEVRVQSLPNYRLLQGQADRILVAGRGLSLNPFPRIDILEFETDPISIDTGSFQGGPIEFSQPLQAALRIVIQESDLNAALQDPENLTRFQDIRADLPFSSQPDRPDTTFDLRHPVADFLPDNRIELAAKLVEKTDDNQELDALDIEFNAGLDITEGKAISLNKPEFVLGSVPVPREISAAFLGGLNDVFDLSDLEEQGIIIRVLKFEVTAETLEIIGFIRVESLPQTVEPVGKLLNSELG